ncbi:APC family permease [soil metagenome]
MSELRTHNPSARDDGTSVGGVLSARHIIFFVVAAAAPLGFAVGSTPLALGRGGTGTVLMFLIVGVFLLLFAAGYLAMSRFVPNAGALFSYIAVGLGRPVGLGAAFVIVFGYAIASAGSIGPFAVFAVQGLDSTLGWSVPWQVLGILAVALMGVLGQLNVELNLRILGVIVIVEVVVLTILGTGIIFGGGADGLSLNSFRPDAISGNHIGVVLLVVFAAFAGFEGTALFREEARDPARTLRRATFGSIAVIAVFQCFVTWAIVQAFGADVVDIANEQPTEMFTIAATTFVGPWLAVAITMLVVVSWFASVVAFHNATTRYLFVLGRDRVLPAALGRRANRTGAAWVASATHTVFALVVVVVCIVLGFDPYLDLFVVGSVPVAVSIPALECLTAVAIFTFFLRDRRGQSFCVVLVAPGLSAIALAVVVYLVVSNIPMFTARTGAINWILPSLNLVILFAGLARAWWIRRSNAERYNMIGRWGGTSGS